MEVLNRKIVQYIDRNCTLEKSQKEIIIFGIQSALEIGLNLLMSVIVICKMDMIKEGIFFFLVFIPLRMYSGGYHADTYIKCFFFSIVTLIVVIRGSVLISIPNLQVVYLIIILCILMWRFGPVSVAERPVSKREYKLFYKRFKRILCAIILLAIGLERFEEGRLLNILFLCIVLVFSTLIWGKAKYHQ